MNAKIVACIFALLETLMLAGQITTLVSTYWTSWDLRFNWTEGGDSARGSYREGLLISEGHAGLWSRCFRIYDKVRESEWPQSYECLNNYNTSNGSLKFTFGKACKTATAALCVGDAALIITILIIMLVAAFKSRSSGSLVKVSLSLILLQGLVCFTIPLTYLSGNMAELITQLTTAYGLLHIVRMTTWYTHDWAFWTQVGLIGIWMATVAVFTLFYGINYSQRRPKSTKAANGKNEGADSTELEVLRK
ncbi:uncharacterized protein LOC118197749 isoform X1 [Stegodyphus dumicola]|uniref:uncharacterized protein LOC118197749 isoform X1 n=1 Tax=Stegodyphus dumicola TaxID=202533 RepID=UPI0015B2973F|nr:uncharacterized protein LOC118197749 isoform X1 [Stegodyphus dumicola]XP_035225191.1 uncharacterized protein LOC118197749 isoform X1 [Stegodyphus dumicola]XP_035225197.1 uncharacterized protein LOC118197749 isoform X1 [Stegodyphus dumicola]XP_035225201.1 uncharacterized protein LOC118197749 isoform X1 [Stegodyphus dumicola]